MAIISALPPVIILTLTNVLQQSNHPQYKLIIFGAGCWCSTNNLNHAFPFVADINNDYRFKVHSISKQRSHLYIRSAFSEPLILFCNRLHLFSFVSNWYCFVVNDTVFSCPAFARQVCTTITKYYGGFGRIISPPFLSMLRIPSYRFFVHCSPFVAFDHPLFCSAGLYIVYNLTRRRKQIEVIQQIF